MSAKSLAVPWVAFAIEFVLIGGIAVVLRTFCSSQDNGVLLTLGIALALSAGFATMASRESFTKSKPALELLRTVGVLVLLSLVIHKYYYPRYCNVNGNSDRKQHHHKKVFYGDAQQDEMTMLAAQKLQAAAAAQQQSVSRQGKYYSQITAPSNPSDQNQKKDEDNDSSSNLSSNSGIWFAVSFSLLSLQFYFSLLQGMEQLLAMAGQ